MTFEQLHGDVLEVAPDIKTYKSLSNTGLVQEAWEKRDDGKWYDVTLREQELQKAEMAVKKAKKELAKLEEQQDDIQDNSSADRT